MKLFSDRFITTSRSQDRGTARGHTPRIVHSPALLALYTLCLVFGFAQYGSGQVPALQVLPDDSPVLVDGRVGDDNSFVKRIGLYSASEVSEVLLRSSDLRRSGGPEQINRQQINPTSGAKFDLPGKTPKDFEIKIAGIKVPGIYKGKLYFLLPGQGLKAALEIPITVIAEGVPKLSLRKGSDSVRIQLVNCSLLGCALAKAIEPSAFPSSYPLQLDNGTTEPFNMTSSVTAIGDVSRQSLEKTLRIQSSVDVTVAPVYSLPIEIMAGHPPPDHYIGDIQLRFAGQDAPLKIPLEVNVREGPVLPVFAILIGIFLGRLLKYMAEKGRPQSDLLLRVYQLEATASLWPDDEARVRPMLEEVKAKIYDMELDEAKKEFTAIGARWGLLTTLRDLEHTLAPRKSEPAVQAILLDIANARNLTAARRDQEASSLVTQIETKVVNLPPAPSGTTAFTPVAARAQARAATRFAVQATAAVHTARQRPWDKLLGFIARIRGAVRAELTLWVVRPLIYVFLIVALLAIGVQQLYLKNPVFGSAPVSDYLGLLVWAMSSDVASRTLSNLKT